MPDSAPSKPDSTQAAIQQLKKDRRQTILSAGGLLVGLAMAAGSMTWVAQRESTAPQVSVASHMPEPPTFEPSALESAAQVPAAPLPAASGSLPETPAAAAPPAAPPPPVSAPSAPQPLPAALPASISGVPIRISLPRAGSIFLDGASVGNKKQLDLKVVPGLHTFKVSLGAHAVSHKVRVIEGRGLAISFHSRKKRPTVRPFNGDLRDN